MLLLVLSAVGAALFVVAAEPVVTVVGVLAMLHFVVVDAFLTAAPKNIVGVKAVVAA